MGAGAEVSVTINMLSLGTKSYSARSAGKSGVLNVAHVATTDAASPDTNTPTSNKPSEIPEKRPAREKNTGAIASSAQKVPVATPANSSSAFSAIIITVKWLALYPTA